MRKFGTYLNEAQIVEDKIVQLNEATFSKGNMRKVSDLLAKIAGKKLGGKYHLGWVEDFKKSSAASGTGLRYLNTNGTAIRFNHLNGKNNFSINSVDYWKKATDIGKPSMSLYFDSAINIVHLKEQLFDALKSGKITAIKGVDLVEYEAQEVTVGRLLREETRVEMKKRIRKEFAIKHGLDTNKEWDWSNAQLTRNAEAAGLTDELKDWMNIKMNDSEKSTTTEAVQKAEKSFDKVRFQSTSPSSSSESCSSIPVTFLKTETTLSASS